MARNILPDQLRRIREHMGQVRNHAEAKQLADLLYRGRPLLKIAREVYRILEKDEAMVNQREAACRERLVEFSGDDGFRGEVEEVLSQQTDVKTALSESVRSRSTRDTVVENVEKLLSAVTASISNGSLPKDLPVVTRKNLKSYSKFVSETQIGKIARLIREQTGGLPINTAEKRLLIIAYQYLRDTPGSVAKDVQKQIVLRYKRLHADKT